MEEQASGATEDGLYAKAKASPFHFKSGSTRRSRRRDNEDNNEDADRHSRKRHKADQDEDARRHHRHSRRKHKHKHRTHDDRHPTSTRDGTYYDPGHRHRESLFDNLEESGAASPETAPEDAFRESLFDALADDEGAAYWEGVYGQPVHIYPDVKRGADGKLERMTEEEYADYVRTKMWEKSHQHILEEREAKERARQKRKAQRSQLDEELEREETERENIRRRMEESLRRGEERKKAKEAEAAWDNYTAKWDSLKNAQHPNDGAATKARDLIPWPVVSGQAKHVSKDEIERFLRTSKSWREDSVALLKAERVRWHPDKMQQRFREHMDADTMKLVTAVFQIIDQLWNNRR
ncbi:hypothetical protein COCSADRAFT_37572 [Bipolaris sorokiniana ND90Pr]|uniref:NF-kappa-B inhibitor-like protein 1 n=1 Tax=Cochliobolus sativus (strain ND90Pr / ATCC 201652) TaxID=665912 RepID=M2S8Z8_COCSN|nr:uncharacterized protein COCSADRAFT_37572 [Bipolaris sorokiniana ND90Pr]EMD63823.1 hypothetical protein COCSADRAFT_37572 [Bipolaris sorokiniana ND90Pr]